MNENWIVVKKKKGKHTDEPHQIVSQTLPPAISTPLDTLSETKINEPCWFFNNGGCRHKDSTEKTEDECKYLHVLSNNVRRPPHLCARKPCDKYNLEGECKWNDHCKYSHRNLTPEEWDVFYPQAPYALKTNLQKRVQLENKIHDIEEKIKILEYKLEGMSTDLQNIGRLVQNIVRNQN